MCYIDSPPNNVSHTLSLNGRNSNDNSRMNIKSHTDNNNNNKEVKKQEVEKKPCLTEDKEFLSHVSEHFLLYFDQQQYPTKSIHGFLPFIMLVRSVMISVSVFGLVEWPFVQVYVVLTVEVLYMVVVVLYNNKMEVSEKTIDVYNCVSNSVYVILKLITVYNIDDSKRQHTYGVMMMIVLVLNLVVNIGYVVYSTYRVVKLLCIMLFKKCTESDEEKKRNRYNSIWCETNVYECTKKVVERPAIPISAQKTKKPRVLHYFIHQGGSSMDVLDRRIEDEAQTKSVEKKARESEKKRKELEDDLDVFDDKEKQEVSPNQVDYAKNSKSENKTNENVDKPIMKKLNANKNWRSKRR